MVGAQRKALRPTNVADEDILGSMEFPCKVAGAKVALVMGHTACGGISAIDGGAAWKSDRVVGEDSSGG